MVPDTLINYFLASAGAALVGLVFVAISLSPKETMSDENAPQWRAVAGSAFFAFMNAFTISLSALNTGLNLGWPVLVLSLIGLSNTTWLGLPLLKRTKERKRLLPRIIANRIMILAGLAIYGVGGYFGVHLLLVPRDAVAVERVAIVLMFTYGLGIMRAWELIGIEQLGVRRWLNPLQTLKPSTQHPEEESEPTSSLVDPD
jgi:quinol-cytochrome oxidoreductase complex cytochrome b subunit